MLLILGASSRSRADIYIAVEPHGSHFHIATCTWFSVQLGERIERYHHMNGAYFATVWQPGTSGPDKNWSLVFAWNPILERRQLTHPHSFLRSLIWMEEKVSLEHGDLRFWISLRNSLRGNSSANRTFIFTHNQHHHWKTQAIYFIEIGLPELH